MPRNRSTTVVASPAAAAETVIAQLSVPYLPLSSVLDIEATVDITIGTSGITATFKIERGTVAGGTLVGSAYGPFTVVAANRYNFTINAQDTFANDVANQQYVLTATIGSGAATSTVNAVYISGLFGF